MESLKKVYLAGGMKSGWQDVLYKAYFMKIVDSDVPSSFNYARHHDFDCIYFDPRDNRAKDPQVFTNWDIFHLKQSDIVFAYLEQDNPSGIGLAAEIGYAKALGQTVIFVNEQSDNRYVKFVEEISDVVVNTFEEGVVILARLIGSDHSSRDVFLRDKNITNMNIVKDLTN